MFWQNTSRWVLPQTDAAGDPPHAGWAPQAGYEVAPVTCTEAPFTELILSWNAETPPGTAIRLEARVRYGAEDAPPSATSWSAWQELGHWGSGAVAGVPLPRSGPAPPAEVTPPVAVDIDTLRVAPGYAAQAFGLRLTLYGGAAGPVVRRLAVSTAHRRRPPLAAADDPPLGTAVHLPVPARSQRVEHADLVDHICSPTSVGMVLQYYGVDLPTAQVAAGVFDHEAEIYGNWPFNVAFAGSLGLQGVVRHFATLGALERELQQGHPVIISIAFAAGELPEAPISDSAGHLLVVTGVTAAGDFEVNDPAAYPQHGQAVERVYGREHLRGVFLGHGGIGYVIARDPEPAPCPARGI